MKKSYILLMIFFICGCETPKQNFAAKSNSEHQEENFEAGNKYLKSKKLDEAFRGYHLSVIYDENSEIANRAKIKIDSILPLIQKGLLKKWQGNWKIKELIFDPFPGSFPDYIEFDKNEVIFYEEISSTQKKLIRKEMVKFVEYSSSSLYSDNYNLKFKNSEIWSFNLVKKNGLLKLYPTLERDSTGKGILLHQANMSKKKRKQDEMKEKYTFYIKVK